MQLLPATQARLVNGRGAKTTTAARMQFKEHIPSATASHRQIRHIKLGHMAAGAFVHRLQVFAQSASIGLPFVQLKNGLCMGKQRRAQALIKSSWSFMALSSCLTSH